jgi:HD-GYP domain-containing protein (c-di-GMP phosphodiesterase class II)
MSFPFAAAEELIHILSGRQGRAITRKGGTDASLIPPLRESRGRIRADDGLVTTAAAPPLAPARASTELDDELVRRARESYERRRLHRHERLMFVPAAIAVAAGCVATALFLHGGPPLRLHAVALFVVLYALVSRVEFEIGTGSAIPTELVLVPMIFSLPIGLVPGAVAAGLLLRTVGDRPWPLRSPSRLFPLVATTSHAIGPVLVIALAGGLPLRWSAWPIYVAAFGAQLAFDFGNASVNIFANRVRMRTLLGFVGLAYVVDASLAPIGLMIAFTTRAHAELAVLVLPLVALLRYFSRERQRRIDHALELSDAYRGTAFLLGDVVEADDAYTGTHSRHVVDLVLGVSDELQIGAADRRDAEFVALLHDVGKIRIPAEIINKPGALTAEERAVIETHTIEGEQMLERVGGLLAHVGRLVRSCHEHWDGNGYPDRLAGDRIPLVARIVCACDAFSAMTTDRPYRDAMTADEARAELVRCAGSQFDPDVVAALVRVSLSGAG